MFDDVINIIRQYGPICGPLTIAVTFFIWRDWKREASLLDKVNKMEEDYKKILIPMVTTCCEVIARNSVIMERNTTVMEENSIIMRAFLSRGG